MGWRADLRHYFILNKRERRGFAYLFVLLLILVLIRISLPYWLLEDETLSSTAKKRLEQLKSNFKKSQSQADFENHSVVETNNERFSLPSKKFNPNNIDVKSLIDLGLKNWQAERFIKYRNRIGAFHKSSDILAVYGIDSNWVEYMSPYMIFDSSSAISTSKNFAFNSPKDEAENQRVITIKSKKIKPEEKSISLNMADTTELQRIPGIGSYFAKLIVKQRQKLGGFYAYDQLIEIPYMKDQAIDALATYTYLDSTEVQRLNINTASLEQLGQHPYITWAQARAIVNYRKQHGDFKKLEEIQKTDVMSPSEYVKIAPYLFLQ